MRHRLYGRQRDRRVCELTMRRVCEFPLSEATWCDLAVNKRPPTQSESIVEHVYRC